MLRRCRKDQRPILDFVNWELACADRVLYLFQRHHACGFDGAPGQRCDHRMIVVTANRAIAANAEIIRRILGASVLQT
jgi:hypothetical protein